MFNAIVKGVGLVSLCRNDGRNVLEKVDAALVARATMPLLVVARRTRVEQRGVAAGAKAGYLARFRTTLRAFHSAILPGSHSCRRPGLADLHPRR
jgi:hypothetical protein